MHSMVRRSPLLKNAVNNAGKFHPKKQKPTRDYCTVEAQNEEGLVLAK
jgi:hypothetical protein